MIFFMQLNLNIVKSATLIYILVCTVHLESANAVLSGSQLQSHRAIYELSLGSLDVTTGLSGISGKIEYEFSGSECDGFTTNVRFLINFIYDSGKSIETNLTSSTYENIEDSNFQFAHKSLIETEVIENLRGFAQREGDDLVVDLQLPKQEQFKIKQDALFPTEHILRTIDQAKSGSNFFVINTYDGTEDGMKVYYTTTFIGNKSDSKQLVQDTNSIEMQKFGDVAFWPITFAYFDSEENSDGEQTPVYEFVANLYENGVHSKLRLKYPEYSINGKLVEFDYLADSEC